MTQVNADQWVTLSEASTLTGKSMDSLRTMIRRGKLTQVKKVRGKRGDEWVIHREAVHDAGQAEQPRQNMTQVNDNPDQCPASNPGQVITLPVDFYAQQQKERDQALQGMMMYRWKFEEAEKMLRLLPAPPELVARELEDKAQALAQAEKILEEAQETQKAYVEAMDKLRAKLQEEECAKETFRLQWEAAQAEPWWKKIWRKR